MALPDALKSRRAAAVMVAALAGLAVLAAVLASRLPFHSTKRDKAALASTATAAAKEKIRLSAADTAAARAVLIRRSDLTPSQGWQGGPVKPDLSEIVCPYHHPKYSDLVLTGAAENDWERPELNIISLANVLQSESMVRRDIRRTATLAGFRCSLESSGLENVAAASVPFPKFTDQTTAWRGTYTLRGHKQVIEAVYIGSGRTEIAVAAIAAAGTPADPLHNRLVQAALIMFSRVRV